MVFLCAGEILVLMNSAAAFVNVVCKVNRIPQPDGSACDGSSILIGNSIMVDF